MRLICHIGLLFTLCFGLHAAAQSQTHLVVVQVSDSLSKLPLVGARVKLICGKDTLSRATDGTGQVNFNHSFRADSLEISVHFLGYTASTAYFRVPPTGQGLIANFRMVQSPEEIAEIIVVGKQLAMVVKGDTVKYNASSFKTFQNDPMSALFEVLPGMNFENGVLTFLGEPVQRINIDGKNLFNNQVSTALQAIRADDVIDIRVTKITEEQDRGEKKRILVADVQTRSKPNYIRQRNVEAHVGSAVKRDAIILNPKLIHHVNGKQTTSQVGETFRASTGLDNTDGYPRPLRNVHFNGEYYNAKKSFLRLNSLIKASIRENRALSRLERRYQDAGPFALHNETTTDSIISKDKQLDLQNFINLKLPKRQEVGFTTTLAYQNLGSRRTLKDWLFDQGETIRGQYLGQTSLQDKLHYNLSGSYGLNLTPNFRSWLTVSAGSGRVNGENIQVDSTTIIPMALHKNGTRAEDNHSRAANISFSWQLHKDVHLNISDNIAIYKNAVHRRIDDPLSGELDRINSADYLFNEFGNNLKAVVNYTDENKELGLASIRLDGTLGHIKKRRVDSYPWSSSVQRHYNLINARASAEYKLGGFDAITFDYSIESRPPDLERARFLNTENMFDITIGNFDLKPNLKQVFDLKSSFIAKNAVYLGTIAIESEKNSFVLKTLYLSEDSLLNEFDFIAAAGSRITQAKNRSGYLKYRASINREAILSKWKVILKTLAHYSHSYTPVYVFGQPYLSFSQAGGLIINLSGNFSSNFIPVLKYEVRGDEAEFAGGHRQSLTQSLSFNFRVQLSKFLQLESTNGVSETQFSPRNYLDKRQQFTSSINLIYNLKSNGDLTVICSLRELGNKMGRISIQTTEEFDQKSYRDVLGPNGRIGVQYKF